MNQPQADELQLQIQARLVEEITRRDRQFETLIDLMEEIVFRCDAEGRFLLVNAAWQARTGYEIDSTLGQSMVRFVHRPEQKARILKALQNDESISLDVEIETRYGNLRSCNLKARRDGESWYGSMFDVTEQNLTLRALRESENKARKLSLVAKRTDNMVIITSPEGEIEWVNEGFERSTGYQVSEVIGRRPGDLLQGPETSKEVVAHMSKALRRHEGFEVEVINYDKYHRPYWASVECTPVFDHEGQLQNFIAIERDISESKKAELAMVRAKEEAEALTDTRTRFVANMSHEIRTPLNAILGMTTVLERTGLNVEQRGCLEILRSSGKALLELVNDVLDFSKLEAGQLKFDEVSFSACEAFEEAVEIITPTLYEKRLSLSLEIAQNLPTRFRGDPHRLRQVVLNLLSNAAKFTSEGGIRIGLGWRDADVAGEGVMEVTIADTGFGIEADRIHVLFDEFTQADPSTTRRFGGTGLGLAICRQICELAGGKIWAESEPGQGTEFHFEFPLKVDVIPPLVNTDLTVEYPAGADQFESVIQAVTRRFDVRLQPVKDGQDILLKTAGKEPVVLQISDLRNVMTPARIWKAISQSVGWTNNNTPDIEANDSYSDIKVLVAEDVLANQVVIKALLKSLEVDNVRIVENGKEAVDAVKADAYDLVLMDMHMPVLDGMAACEEIRKSPLNGQPYIVSVSADVTTEARQQARQAGIDECMAKPVTRTDLQNLLGKLCDTRLAANG